MPAVYEPEDQQNSYDDEREVVLNIVEDDGEAVAIAAEVGLF